MARGLAQVAALALAALGFGLATTGTKYALGGFAPVGLLTVQLLAATVVLWIALPPGIPVPTRRKRCSTACCAAREPPVSAESFR